MIDRHPDGLVVLHENRFDLPTSRIEGRVTLLHPDGGRAESRHSVRVYTATELAAMCRRRRPPRRTPLRRPRRQRAHPR